MKQPHYSCTSTDDRVLIEVWEPAIASKSWRITRKERPGVNIPHALVATAPYRTEEAALAAFDKIKATIRQPVELIATSKRKAKGKR